ncbi:MAG: hypothetical protein ACLQU5_21765 [Isosphaeraceae bacterium]
MAQTLSIENHLREHRARRSSSQEELARRSVARGDQRDRDIESAESLMP